MKITITPHPFADWFFPQVSVRVLRLIQIGFGAFALAQGFLWSLHTREFFTSEGIASASYVQQTTVYSHLSIFFKFDAPWFVYICMGLFLLAALGMIFGKLGRLSAILTWFFFISFASRFPLLFYGAIDHMHSMFCFNMFLPAIAYKGWKHGGVKERDETVPAWAIRMMQISIAIVYFMAALQKVRSNTWWNGTEILNSLNTRFGAFDFYWLAKYPIIVNVLSYISWLSELAFATLVWDKPARRFILVMLIGLHISVLFVMNASLFSEAMIVSLMTFVTPKDEAWFAQVWNSTKKRLALGIKRSRSLRRA